MTMFLHLQNDKRALAHTRIATRTHEDLEPGEAMLKIDRLALTANNITYAAFGDVPHLRYWNFFPTGEDEVWGHIPAWGFATLVSSTVPGLEPGERFYGYWPIASHLVVRPIRVSERGFYDDTPHRRDLTSAYNQYQRTRTDAAYRIEDENYQALLRPLFITSFMLADFLHDNAFFGAKQIAISSASSKTAYGAAFCLHGQTTGQLTALTSASNLGFVNKLGCYDRALRYEEVASIDATVPTLYVDFSGSEDLRRRVHEHLGERLVYSCYAGSAQSHDHISKTAAALPGPKPEPYFAPYQIKKRNQDWGPAEVTRRFNEAQRAFIRRVSDPAGPFMNVIEHEGFAAGQALIAALVDGKIDPKDGHILRL